MPGVPPAPTGSLSGVAYFLESEFLQRIKALACYLGVRGFTRLLIHEALALGALQEGLGALCIAFLAGVVAEIELGKVTVQMGICHVVERAYNAAIADEIGSAACRERECQYV